MIRPAPPPAPQPTPATQVVPSQSVAVNPPAPSASDLQHAGCSRVVGFALSALYTNVETSFISMDSNGNARFEWSNFRSQQRGYCVVNGQGQVVEMKVNP
ncbi:MAG: hypothetical protein HC838_13305 [Spirulinaceae cyanobacterium RM2_2_10]|nr:hypothetical protein [Spirulinaceae cyanobacterium RM2_2_10]